MSEPRLKVEGFEEALAAAIAVYFKFTHPALSGISLVAGRHLFANRMPEAADIVRDLVNPATFDPKVEPVIGLFGGDGSTVNGSKHTFVVEFQLRIPREANHAGKLLGQLVDWLPSGMRGQRIDGFIVKSAKIQTLPSGFVRVSDGTHFAKSKVRFLAVPTI